MNQQENTFKTSSRPEAQEVAEEITVNNTASSAVENPNIEQPSDTATSPAQQTAAAEEQLAPQETENPLVDHDNLTALQDELEQASAKARENWNLYLGARADTENVRRRAERDLQNAHKFALDKFVNELLPVKDSLEMGIAAANEIVGIKQLREGSELTLKMLTTAMEKFGVQEVNPLGEKFNPDLHQAIAMQPAQQVEPNTVLQVIQKGYLLNERLVRPAMVIVAQTAK